jgi:hypothetical protein
MRYRVDRTWLRSGPSAAVVLAGSPVTMFRLSAAGCAMVDRIVAGDDVPASTLVDRLLDAGAIHPQVTHRRDALPDVTHRDDGAATGFGIGDVSIVTPQLGGVVRHRDRVVVDDGSTPPLVGATTRLEANRGPAAARNEGRRHVDTPLIAFIDADVDLPFERSDETIGVGVGNEGGAAALRWWAPLLAHFDDPRVGAVAPRVVGDEGSSLDLGAEPARIRAGTRVSYVPAAAIIVRVEAFDDIGGFDETLRFGEDVDFVWRLDQAGWRSRYEPAVTVAHQRRPTVIGRLAQQVGYGSSSAPLALRHPSALAPFRSDGWTALSWLLVALGRPTAGVGLAASRAVALVPKLPDVAPLGVLRLATTSQVMAAQQLARAARRAWWPLIAIGSIVSRRVRRIAAVAVVVAPHRLVADLAFGAGLWAGMIRRREWRPIIPVITRGPAPQRHR